MKELDLLWRGMIAGFVIAAPVGPVNVFCMQRTLARGWRSGLASGFGAAAGDTLYGAVAGFSITYIVDFLVREQARIRLFGGILLVAIGISYLLRGPQPLHACKERVAGSDLLSTFLLNLTNPTVVLSFLAVLAALGLADRRPWGLTLFLVGGIFCGSMSWWIVLCAAVNHFRDRFNDRSLAMMNRIAGLAIGGFGVWLFVLSRTRL